MAHRKTLATPKTPELNRHIPELQSLRGIAAAVVLIHHASFLFETGPVFHRGCELLLNAHAAVILFFVLSGYVLSRALSGDDIGLESVAKFYISRCFRIYPAALVAGALGAVYYLTLHQNAIPSGVTHWYITSFPHSIGPREFISSLCCAGNSFDPPLWSVRVELVASIFFPFIVLAIRRGLGLYLLTISTLLALFVWSDVNKLDFAPSFALGALAFHYQGKIGRYFDSVPVIAGSTALLVLFRQVDATWRFDVGYHAVVPGLVESLAAALLIVGLVQRTVRPLRAKLATRLGDISYSVYLFHWTVMSCLVGMIGSSVNNHELRAWLLMAGSFAFTLPVAMVSYERIEKPGAALGRKLIAVFTNDGKPGALRPSDFLAVTNHLKT